jgi:hypothetical protein
VAFNERLLAPSAGVATSASATTHAANTAPTILMVMTASGGWSVSEIFQSRVAGGRLAPAYISCTHAWLVALSSALKTRTCKFEGLHDCFTHEYTVLVYDGSTKRAPAGSEWLKLCACITEL